MSATPDGQNRIGVDVGGTFTDLVSLAPDGSLHIVKVPSTPPHFEQGVLSAIRQSALRTPQSAMAAIVHGSTVATNALLERKGERIAFITTEGFRDLLLIGRQNRPRLYDLHVQRPRPIVDPADCFTVDERLSATGEVLRPLADADIDRVLTEIESRGIRHLAVCLLFSFVNPDHEQRLAAAAAKRGLTCSLSSDILPEYREYERASTTAINASLRPTVEAYLTALATGLAASHCGLRIADCGMEEGGEGANPGIQSAIRNPQSEIRNLTIMQSSGGTLSIQEAGESAVRLLLSGPAGGVIGAGFVASQSGLSDIITYDMGGTSTDVACILSGKPEWTTQTTLDGLPVGVPLFDIQTVGAGGGSIASLDPGGSLRVGPRSAGADPGPACYARGGTEPTVTDANLLLGRILPSHFLGGRMSLDRSLAEKAVGGLAAQMGKTLEETSLGIVRIVESNMEHAIRAVSSRRGHDPRSFTLVSFGGAGGLHACRLAESLEIPRVLIPPYAGVLSALGMVVAPPIAEASKTVLHLGELVDDSRLPAEFGYLSGLTSDRIPPEQTARTEVFADVRFTGQSHELTVPVTAPTIENIQSSFFTAYQHRYGQLPTNRTIEIVTLRIRRTARTPQIKLPPITHDAPFQTQTTLIDPGGFSRQVPALNRSALFSLRIADCGLRNEKPGTAPSPPSSNPQSEIRNPQWPTGFLLIDPESTAYIPPGWTVQVTDTGSLLLSRDPKE